MVSVGEGVDRHPVLRCFSNTCARERQEVAAVCDAIDRYSLEGVGLVGLNYRTSDLAVRSRLALTGERLCRLYRTAAERGFSGVLYLGTCSRSELYFTGVTSETAVDLLSYASEVPAHELRPHLYVKQGICAACHLFRVSSGLDSAVLGESEIVAQVKQAHGIAEMSGGRSSALNLLFQRALMASKRVRSETDLCRQATSMAYLAVKEAMRLTPEWLEADVLVIGAGQIAERVAKELEQRRPRRVVLANRTIENAERLGEQYGFHPTTLEHLDAEVAEADVLISAVAGDHLWLRKEFLQEAMRDRPARPLTLVDLGVPPSIEKGENTDQLRFVDIDTLAAISAVSTERKEGAIPEALEIINEEILGYLKTLQTRQASPTIEALTSFAELVRQENVRWAFDKLGELNPKQAKVIEDLSSRIVKGLLQRPIHELKTELNRPEHRDVVTKLFQLEDAVVE